jgi:hypothetical protein
MMLLTAMTKYSLLLGVLLLLLFFFFFWQGTLYSSRTDKLEFFLMISADVGYKLAVRPVQCERRLMQGSLTEGEGSILWTSVY